ncbi:multinuclear nonheme iron-dependent oxidase [Thiothrix subterranea]|uniref:DUF692 family protein n=1 Tax=Thiothrix subterranea TaxID=2735563 RepID=A0AA51MMT4_9GAMM|nr:DUF692 family multinuclear iron-containing protein [Thiothrix subterranea]WML86805.1 DUF692 family protein [Thiothrix subterranea]
MSHPVKGCGIGLRFQHIDTIADSKPPIPWLEILTDNYLLPGSVQQDYLCTPDMGMNSWGASPL